jgi:transposase InsO family protein
VDSDNGSEFINWHLKRWCEQKGIQLTRGRPYKKDDNAHVEQKNWTHVRKLLGWDRYDTAEAVEAINDLYRHELRLWLNLFLPSVKLVRKVRVGSRVRRVYDGPRTPFERVRQCPQADQEQVTRLEELRKHLDPFQLARLIERKLERIYRLADRRLSPKAVKGSVVEPRQPTRRGNGCGKDVPASRDLEIPAGFPPSHSRNNSNPSVTFQMSRRRPLRLHS